MRYSAAEFFSLAISAIFIQNIVMIYLLGSDTFFKALKSPVSGIKFGVLVTISTTVASALAWILNRFLLVPFEITWLTPFAFVLVIVLFELAAEFALRFKKELRRQLGDLLPASAFNCAVLGLVFINVQQYSKGFVGTLYFGFCAGAGFILALFAAANAMERVRNSTPPLAFKGLPIALVTASLLSLAFMGFSGMQIPY